MNNIWVVLLVSTLVTIAVINLLYWVIKAAVLAALRAHDKESSAVKTVPSEVI